MREMLVCYKLVDCHVQKEVNIQIVKHLVCYPLHSVNFVVPLCSDNSMTMLPFVTF